MSPPSQHGTMRKDASKTRLDQRALNLGDLQHVEARVRETKRVDQNLEAPALEREQKSAVAAIAMHHVACEPRTADPLRCNIEEMRSNPAQFGIKTLGRPRSNQTNSALKSGADRHQHVNHMFASYRIALPPKVSLACRSDNF